MKTEIDITELIKKKQQMIACGTALKSTFIGLDAVIDDVINLMMPWFLFPQAQTRPTLINMWGLTGSGKSALVKEIVRQLDYSRMFTHMDMGEFESDSATWIKKILTDDLDFFHGKPAIICLDEFQFARTIDAHENELGKDKLRVIWELLDSGKIEYIPGNSTYYLFKADNCLKRIERLKGCNMMLINGEIIGDEQKFREIFDGFFFDDVNLYGKTLSKDYFVSKDFTEGMFYLFDNDQYSKDTIASKIRSGTLEDLRQLITEGMKSRPATKTLDLSQSLIFVLGNLDEAYSMSRDMNPDISADAFHAETSKITITMIKRALRKRFRSEQIARLGNNHIIYTSFTNEQFRILIRQELDKLSLFVTKHFSWNLEFEESVVNVVYAEGVFPAQGTRPVFTTIRNLIESRISKLIVSVLENNLAVSKIVWSYAEEVFTYTLIDATGKVVSVIPDKVRLKLDHLRKSIDPELQAHTAVHEAGHAVLAALTFRILPSVVVSRTAADAEGFCMINFPTGPMTRDSLCKDIVITLGGYVAEKMVFGEDLTSAGVYADIEEASALANKAVRQFAMGSDPIHLAAETPSNENAFFDHEKYSGESIRLIRECEAEATAILQRNKLLLLKIAEYLTANTRMEESAIGEYVRRYAAEPWVCETGFIKKEEYYRFHAMLQEQLRALNVCEADLMIENLLSFKDDSS